MNDQKNAGLGLDERWTRFLLNKSDATHCKITNVTARIISFVSHPLLWFGTCRQCCYLDFKHLRSSLQMLELCHVRQQHIRGVNMSYYVRQNVPNQGDVSLNEQKWLGAPLWDGGLFRATAPSFQA